MSSGDRIIRARQRSRTSLPAYSQPFVPLIKQVAVDRMQIGVRGAWRIEPSSALVIGFSDHDYEAALTERANRWQWFRKPEKRQDQLILRTLAQQGSLLKSSRICVSGLGTGVGKIWVSLTCNPTETLANRIAFLALERGHRSPDEFVDQMRGMAPRAFFSRHGVPPSLDGRENWLPDYDAAVRLLGDDPFGVFMPIFFHQLMNLVMQLVAPFDSQCAISDDGVSQIFRMGHLSGGLFWGNATAPQIETYVERHHNDAVLMVRSAAQTMLSSLDEVRVRQHLHRISFERQIDMFSIRSELPAERDLSIYAKTPTRLRFEVSRPKRGRYDKQLLNAPIDRLMQIFRSERNDYVECCDWNAVADFFAPPLTPWLGDVVEMLTVVSEVCAANNTSVRPVILAMLADAGASKSPGTNIPSAVLDRLLAMGIIERITLRNRDRSGSRRLVLRPIYREIFRLILTTFEAERASH